MESLIFDTTFLIDFQREHQLGQGKAHKFLEAHADAIAYLTVTVYGEFAEGFANPTDSTLLTIVDSFELLPVTRATDSTYAQITRDLRA
ncbi:MAG: hypothetical protein WCG66_04060 [bacterium]